MIVSLLVVLNLTQFVTRIVGKGFPHALLFITVQECVVELQQITRS